MGYSSSTSRVDAPPSAILDVAGHDVRTFVPHDTYDTTRTPALSETTASSCRSAGAHDASAAKVQTATNNRKSARIFRALSVRRSLPACIGHRRYCRHLQQPRCGRTGVSLAASLENGRPEVPAFRRRYAVGLVTCVALVPSLLARAAHQPTGRDERHIARHIHAILRRGCAARPTAEPSLECGADTPRRILGSLRNLGILGSLEAGEPVIVHADESFKQRTRKRPKTHHVRSFEHDER